MGRRGSREATILGLRETLEDELLKVIDDISKESSFSIEATIPSDTKQYEDKTKLEEYIKSIVYNTLQEIFGSDLIRVSTGRSFREQLFFLLEKEGFIRNCPTCYFNMGRLGKAKSPKDYYG